MREFNLLIRKGRREKPRIGQTIAKNRQPRNGFAGTVVRNLTLTPNKSIGYRTAPLCCGAEVLLFSREC